MGPSVWSPVCPPAARSGSSCRRDPIADAEIGAVLLRAEHTNRPHVRAASERYLSHVSINHVLTLTVRRVVHRRPDSSPMYTGPFELICHRRRVAARWRRIFWRGERLMRKTAGKTKTKPKSPVKRRRGGRNPQGDRPLSFDPPAKNDMSDQTVASSNSRVHDSIN